MAGGPLSPVSAFPVGSNGHVYPMIYDGAGASAGDEMEMMGVTDASTLTADVIWRLVFELPPSLPSGTLKLRLLSRANATSGDLKVNPKWSSIAPEEDPGGTALSAEGTSTVTWSTGDADVYKETKIDLDAFSGGAIAGEMLHMDLTFEDTSTTLAVESGHLASLIWE